jgi:tight adherence protein C
MTPRPFSMRARGRHPAVAPADLGDVVDLLALALGAGLSIPAAVDAVAQHVRGPAGDVFRDAAARLAAGDLLGDVMASLAERLGEPARPLAAALAMAAHYGAPVVPSLERAALEIRVLERRRLESKARRLPVLLLFPLVLCCLPAFALLTVVPLLSHATRSLTFVSP